MLKSHAIAEVSKADSLWQRLRELNRETASVLSAARAGKNNDLLLRTLMRVENQLKIEGDLMLRLQALQTSRRIHSWADLSEEELTALAQQPLDPMPAI